MTDNRMTELTAMERFRAELEKRGVEFETNDDECAEGEERTTTFKANFGESEFDIFVTVKDWRFDGKPTPWLDVEFHNSLTPEQAVAATLGRPKARSHPYGYESDTGAYDCTRCECGCINDISATYCNDCGGEIEIDEYAEKEFCEYNRNSVFAVKHDDDTLEFGGKRYVAATLGVGKLTAEQVRDAVLENFEEAHETRYDHWEPSKFDWQAIADELNATMGGGECEQVLVDCDDGLMPPFTAHCSKCGKQWGSTPKFCPECGARVVRTRDERKAVER